MSGLQLLLPRLPLLQLLLLLLCFRLLLSVGGGSGEAECGDGELSTGSSEASAAVPQKQQNTPPRRSESPLSAAAAGATTAPGRQKEAEDDRLELMQQLKQLSHSSAAKERLLQVFTVFFAFALL